MPVTVQTATSVDRPVDRQFKIRAVASSRSTARSTQTTRSKMSYSRLTARSTAKTCTLIRALPELRSTWTVDRPNLSQVRSTTRSTGSGQKPDFGQKFKGILILTKIFLNRD